MAIRPLIRRTDTLRLIALGDEAISLPVDPGADAGEAERASYEQRVQALTDYLGGRDIDVGRLTLVDGVAPTWWTIRALTEHERALLDVEGAQNVAHKAYEILRVALVQVDGLDGWRPERQEWCGLSVLTLGCLEWLPRETVRWLAGVIWRYSHLDAEKKRSSGS